MEQKDKKYAEEAGETYRRKVTLPTPKNSPILNNLNNASAKRRKACASGVKFDVTYDNRNASPDRFV